MVEMIVAFPQAEGGDTIGSMPEPRLLTYDDLASFPDDGLRRELHHGELWVSPSPRIRHQLVVARLFNVLFTYTTERNAGLCLSAPTDVVFAPDFVYVPDIVFVATSQLERVTTSNIAGPPSLTVEAVSDSARDRVVKRDIYARFGVGEYWIVDPDADCVEVLLLAGDRYAKPVSYEPGDRLATTLLPGLSIDVAAILAR